LVDRLKVKHEAGTEIVVREKIRLLVGAIPINQQWTA